MLLTDNPKRVNRTNFLELPHEQLANLLFSVSSGPVGVCGPFGVERMHIGGIGFLGGQRLGFVEVGGDRNNDIDNVVTEVRLDGLPHYRRDIEGFSLGY